MEKQIDKIALSLWKINTLISVLGAIFIILGSLLLLTVNSTNKIISEKLNKIVELHKPEAINVIPDKYILEDK